MAASMFSIVLVAVAVQSFLIYRYIVYPVLLSPLSAIPSAHPFASFSNAWILWKRYKGVECSTIYEAHCKYGPVIRLAPNEVSINSATGLKTVYTGGFDKWPWYQSFAHYGVSNMFSTMARAPHTVRKRFLAPVYSKSYLQSSSDLATVSKHLIQDELLPHLTALAASPTPTIEVLEFMFTFAMDMITSHLLGSRSGAAFATHQTQGKSWFTAYRSSKPALVWISEVPGVTAALQKLGIDPIGAEREAQQFIETWMLERCADVAATLGTEKALLADARLTTTTTTTTIITKENLLPPPTPPTQPIVYQQLRAGLESNAATLGHSVSHAISSELLDHTIAGHETVAITMTYLMWELSRRPALQARLHAELLTTGRGLVLASSPAQEPLPSPRALEALPLLDAILKETLRRWAPGPASQPRVVPAGGCVLSGKVVPAGTRVSANAYTLHRNNSVFPQPEEWRPERWLVRAEERKEMDRWFWAFSSGGRICIGNHFAIQEMKLLVGAIYVNFTTEVSELCDMRQKETFTAPPMGERCVLKFVRVEAGETTAR